VSSSWIRPRSSAPACARLLRASTRAGSSARATSSTRTLRHWCRPQRSAVCSPNEGAAYQTARARDPETGGSGIDQAADGEPAAGIGEPRRSLDCSGGPRREGAGELGLRRLGTQPALPFSVPSQSKISAGNAALASSSDNARQSLLRRGVEEFSLSLHPDKTRLIEFGRFAADRRARRGLGKPETFTSWASPSSVSATVRASSSS
jgi:hypothetical protein